MPKNKEFLVVVNVSGDIELGIHTTSPEKALEIARAAAKEMTISSSAYNHKAIKDVGESIDFEVNDYDIEQVSDDKE